MDEERIKQLAQRELIRVGDRDLVQSPFDDLQLFLGALFGKKRLLILKVNHHNNKITKALEDYSKEKGLGIVMLDGKSLTADSIRGEWEFTYENGIPYSNRKKPYYVTDQKQMIIVNHLEEDKNLEVLRAFMYMASLGDYDFHLEDLPMEKLPYGSSYVFIADDKFPLKRFAGISSYWHDEAAVLDLRDFQTRVTEHLGKYKQKTLKISEEGIFHYRGKDIPYEHILPKEKEQFNILERYRADFFDSDYCKGIKLHRYFHHLNSSQAMCINFFYPLIKEKSMESILDILEIREDDSNHVKEVCFEKTSHLDKYKGSATNFDFYIKLDSGTNLYFEIKYCENDFGIPDLTKDPEKYKNKYEHLYRSLLQSNPALKEDYKPEEVFFNHYQVMRNLLHINEDSYVIFIYPSKNKGIRERALAASKEIIENGWKNHFILFTWEDLVGQLKNELNSKELLDYYDKDFSHKYLNV